MKISVIIVTKNRCTLLKKAVASVFLQSYPVHEVIVVDDCSTDETTQYLQSLEDVIVVRNDFSIGGAQARNLGIKSATGDFIAFLDDDDQWLPSKLEKQVKCQKSTLADIVYTGTIVVDENDEEHGRCFHRAIFSARTQISLLNFIGITSTVLIRRTLLMGCSFDPNMPALQEYELFIRLIIKGANVAGVPESLVKYRQVSYSSTVSSSARANFLASKKILRQHGKGTYLFLHFLGLTRIFLQKMVASKQFRRDFWHLLYKRGNYAK